MVDLRGKPPYLPPTHNYTEVMKMAIEKAFKYYGVDPNTHVDPALLSGKNVVIWLTQCTVFLTHILVSQAFAYIKFVPWNNEEVYYRLKVRRTNHDYLKGPLSRNCISFQIILGKRHTYVTQFASIRCVQICLCRQADSRSLWEKLGDYMSVLGIAFIKRSN